MTGKSLHFTAPLAKDLAEWIDALGR